MLYGSKVKTIVRSFEVIPMSHPNIKLLLNEHIAESKAAGVTPTRAAGAFLIKLFASWSLSEKEHLRELAENGVSKMREVMPPELVDKMMEAMVNKFEAEDAAAG